MLNRGIIPLLDMIKEDQFAASGMEVPVFQETADKSINIGQEESFLMETELINLQ